MLNVHTKLISDLDESETYLLLHIAKRLGKKMFCFPSNSTLLKDTKWGKEKLQIVKNRLIEKGIIEVEIVSGRSNNYHIKSDLIGVFIGVDRLSSTPPENQVGVGVKIQPTTHPENQVTKYYPEQVLASNVSLGASAPKNTPIKKLPSEEAKKYLFDQCAAMVPKYDRVLVREFYDYWTEGSTDGKGKLRFQDEDFFDVSRRMTTWKKKDDEKKSQFPKGTGKGPAPTPSVLNKPENLSTR